MKKDDSNKINFFEFIFINYFHNRLYSRNCRHLKLMPTKWELDENENNETSRWTDAWESASNSLVPISLFFPEQLISSTAINSLRPIRAILLWCILRSYVKKVVLTTLFLVSPVAVNPRSTATAAAAQTLFAGCVDDDNDVVESSRWIVFVGMMFKEIFCTYFVVTSACCCNWTKNIKKKTFYKNQ